MYECLDGYLILRWTTIEDICIPNFSENKEEKKGAKTLIAQLTPLRVSNKNIQVQILLLPIIDVSKKKKSSHICGLVECLCSLYKNIGFKTYLCCPY